jgi:hypothetical protein
LILAAVGAYSENDPAAPPLTREEFVSLRDGAKGLMHRIPSEHKARLIELGYIEAEVDRPEMAKILLSMQDLQARALAEIRKQPGCSSVRNIAINHVTDERAENNCTLCATYRGQSARFESLLF